MKDAYWCAQDQTKFADEYFSKVEGLGKNSNVGILSRLQRLARRHFYGAMPQEFVGDMPSSATPNRSGDAGQNVEIRVNWLRSHANTKHQIIVAPRLAWGAKAVNTDSKALAGSARGAAILEFMWSNGKFEQAAISATLGAILCGEDFVFTPWDAQAGEERAYSEETGLSYQGAIGCHLVPSWNVLRDVNARSYDESQWVSVRMLVNRWDLIAKYPAMTDEIIRAPAEVMMGSDGYTSLQATNDDSVMCHWFFHKRTPAMPRGLQSIALNKNCVLEFSALENCYLHLPVHRFYAENLSGTPYGYSSFWEAMGVQDLVTDLQGSLATNIVAYAKQILSAEEDQDLNVYQVLNGPMVLPRPKGSAAPTPLLLSAPNPEMFQHLERYKSDQRMLLGINDMAMGEPPQGPPNAQAWALLSATNVTNNSSEQRAYVAGVKSIGTSLLAIVKEKFTEPRKVSIVGVYGADVPQRDTFTNEDFEGIDEVTVTVDNPLLQSAAGRLPIAQMYLEQGFVQAPEQLEQLITTGRLEPMTQVLRNELIHIAYENEQLINGVNSPVMITDSHQLHIREHRNPTFAPKGRSNPDSIRATNEHIMEHFRMLLEMDPRLLGVLGQAAPPPPPGAGVPPEMPGAGGGGGKEGSPESLSAAMSPPGTGAGLPGEAQAIKPPEAPVNPATGQQVFLP